MKKFKTFSKVLVLMLTLVLLIASASSVFASGTIPINSLERIRVRVTNLEEPVIGEEPNFFYNARTYNQFGYNFEQFEFLYWMEVDLPYDECLNLADSIISGEKPDFDEETMDYYQQKLEEAKVCINEDSEFTNSVSPDKPYDYLYEFAPNKTYVAAFLGVPAYEVDNIVPESYNSSTVISQISTLDISSPSQVRGSTINSNYDLDLTVNGKSSNVRGRYNENNNIFFMIALYSTEIPKQSYKATVNWINAEGKIPESFVLKLMNGTTVVKEQVITKDNAVDEDTWEYDFGEYPTLDDNGNEITYTLAYSEGKDGDLKFFESNQDGFVINNTYIAPEISSKVKMRSIADREINNVKYRIDYNASIKKYSGNADIVLTTTLPFAIDEAKSDLDDGTYDAKTKTITWNYTIENIDKMYDYSTTKNIDLYATAVLPYAIEAKTVGEVTLSDAEGFSESVDVIDNIEAGTGNPKTGDTNLQKYLSIGLIGLAAILMVVSIRRKYSTRKSKVQF